MAFQKGQSGNPSGRPVGSKNRLRNDLLRKFGELLGHEIFTKEQFIHDMEMMEPKDRFAARLKLVEFFVPKAAQEHELNVRQVNSVEKEINKLAGMVVEEKIDSEDDDS